MIFNLLIKIALIIFTILITFIIIVVTTRSIIFNSVSRTVVSFFINILGVKCLSVLIRIYHESHKILVVRVLKYILLESK